MEPGLGRAAGLPSSDGDGDDGGTGSAAAATPPAGGPDRDEDEKDADGGKKERESRGIAFVEVMDAVAVEAALALNGSEMSGRKINVSRALGKEQAKAVSKQKFEERKVSCRAHSNGN